MIIRLANLDDLDGIMAIERAVFAHDAWSAALMAEAMRAPSATFMVIAEADAICGYAGLTIAGDDADVQTIAVLPGSRGQGWGRALFMSLEEYAITHAAQRMFLDVREDNTVALGLYRSRGFSSIGRRPQYYADGCAAIVMRKLFGKEEA